MNVVAAQGPPALPRLVVTESSEHHGRSTKLFRAGIPDRRATAGLGLDEGPDQPVRDPGRGSQSRRARGLGLKTSPLSNVTSRASSSSASVTCGGNQAMRLSRQAAAIDGENCSKLCPQVRDAHALRPCLRLRPRPRGSCLLPPSSNGNRRPIAAALQGRRTTPSVTRLDCRRTPASCPRTPHPTIQPWDSLKIVTAGTVTATPSRRRVALLRTTTVPSHCHSPVTSWLKLSMVP